MPLSTSTSGYIVFKQGQKIIKALLKTQTSGLFDISQREQYASDILQCFRSGHGATRGVIENRLPIFEPRILEIFLYMQVLRPPFDGELHLP